MRGTLPGLLLALFIPAAYCPAGGQSTWTGYVTDTHCGTRCQVTSTMKPDLACVRRCVKSGSKYGLWTGNKVYVLEPQAEAARFAAENVKVTGTLAGGVIRLSAIEPTPSDSPKAQP